MTENERQSLQNQIDAISWYHDFDFGNGLQARTSSHVDHHHRIWKFIDSNLSQFDFRGKTVLDIGAWDGFWSFYAEKHGAKSVLATDDISQNWAEGTGIHLAKKLLQSRIEINQQMSVYQLASMKRKFDVILFLGVYYHLHDPFYALAQIRHCCHENTIVLIDGPLEVGKSDPEISLTFKDHARENLPTLTALKELSAAAYLNWDQVHLLSGLVADTEGTIHRPQQNPVVTTDQGGPGWRWRLKMLLASLGGSRERLRELVEAGNLGVKPTKQPDSIGDRVFLKCSPLSGINPIHDYPPPFGLAAYDSRFRDAIRVVA